MKLLLGPEVFPSGEKIEQFPYFFDFGARFCVIYGSNPCHATRRMMEEFPGITEYHVRLMADGE